MKAKTKKWLRRGVFAGGAGLLLGTVALFGGYFYLKTQVPTLRTAADYAPARSTKLYSDDGQLVGELFKERRTVVPIDAIPKHVVHAFLAAEDAGFYEHEGLDYWGILRAAIKNLRPGAHLQGASTITQQTAKNLVLGAERSYARKMKEVILSREMERLLTKDEILYLYLNQIYFGSGAYGVEEAARTYFGKSIREVDLAEASLLASVPKNPSHYTPAADPVAAKGRQKYVLEQMEKNGWATPEDVAKAMKKPVAQPPPPSPYYGAGPHYVEHVKHLLIERFGRELAEREVSFALLDAKAQEARIQELGEPYVLTRGLTVYLGMHARMQAGAHAAVRAGLEAFSKSRVGWAGPEMKVDVDQLAATKQALHAGFDKRVEKLSAFEGQKNARQTFIWNLQQLDPQKLGDAEHLSAAVRTAPLSYGQRVVALVEQVDSVADEVWLDLGSHRGRIKWKSMEWAKKPGQAAPRDPSEVVRPGDMVEVDVVDIPASLTKRVVGLELVPTPKVQSALVAIDPHTRLVRAVVGGYKSEAGGLNRALQAKRQPGSAFKPVVYAAALANGTITSASTCPDSPVLIRDPWTAKEWRPQNYEDGKYDGNITYRTALMRSKNTCSVKLIEKVGPEQVIGLAKQMGVTAELPSNLTLALGTGDLTVLELANVYATIASGGMFAEPLFIRKIVDVDGTVLEDKAATPVEVMKPAVAFVLTQMMRSVVEEGTATKALVLDRPLAGKTGTSQESRNVWFGGFSAELVATVWVGHDNNDPMPGASGGGTALPIWVNFMGRALSGVPVSEFTAPDDVVFVKVDPATGMPRDDAASIEEAFVAGTEPSMEKAALPSIFIQDDPDGVGPN